MRTTPSADRSLFARIVDNAAVVPPAAAPLGRALAEHRELCAGPASDLLGPLLVPVADASGLRSLTARRQGAPTVQVRLVARAGTRAEDTVAALETLRGARTVQVTGVDLGADADWRAALRWDLPLSVEVPRDPRDQHAALRELSGAVDEAVRLQAALHATSTPEQPGPTPEDLAGFLVGCTETGLALTLTGGLHHAVRRTPSGSGPEEQHGVLNLLLAVHRVATGAGRGEVTDVLAEEDAGRLSDEVAALDAEAAALVRDRFTSFASPAVLDPLRELAALGLITQPQEETAS